MKKRLISLIVVAFFCALLMPNLSACSIGVEDLAGYVAGIENASAVGIGKMSVTKNSVKARANAQAGVMAVPVTLDNVSVEQTKDYLLTATETEDGYEYEKLSFTKIENSLFGEVKGEKEYVSADGTLSFFANKGFKYTVLVDGEEVFSEIEDNFAEDENKKQGVITLSGLEEGKTYVVRHRGKGKEKVLTQDEMKAHISRVYVSGNFTFVVFVGKGGSDPDWSMRNGRFGGKDALQYNKCRSFIIDNESGKVYSLDDVEILSTNDGIATVNRFEYEDENGNWINSRLPYDMSINDKDELVFTPLATNMHLFVESMFKDKYGRKYIGLTDESLAGYYDESTNTYFYSVEDRYYKNSYGEAVRVKETEIKVTKNDSGFERQVGRTIEEFYVVDENGTERELNGEDKFYLFTIFDGTVRAYVDNCWIKSLLGDCRYYNYLSNNPQYYDLNCVKNFWRVGYMFPFDVTGNSSDYSAFFDDGVLFFINDNNLYYCKDIWNCMKKQTNVSYIKLIDNCSATAEDSFVGFKKAGINGEVYYTVKETIVGGKRTYEAVEAGSYEGNATSFTLQPLNR